MLVFICMQVISVEDLFDSVLFPSGYVTSIEQGRRVHLSSYIFDRKLNSIVYYDILGLSQTDPALLRTWEI